MKTKRARSKFHRRFREQVQSTSSEHISVSILPKQRYIRKTCLQLSYLMFDHFFCIYIIVLMSLYCCFGGWMQVRVYLNFYF